MKGTPMIALSIASWSFHRLLESGQQDMFKYITNSKDLGATQLDPWNGHLAPLVAGDNAMKARKIPNSQLSQEEKDYLAQVKAAADKAGMPFGCLVVDGAAIYEPTPEGRALNRAVAYRWLEAANMLGAKQMRVDAGGPAEMPPEVFTIIVEGYKDLVKRSQALGIELLIENHWGSSPIPENLIRILEAVPGLGLLFDTNNFHGDKERAWETFARYARSVHIKTFSFDAQGNDPSVNLSKAIRLLVNAGYNGTWGVESVPKDGDEMNAVKKTFALIRKTIEAMS
jgi:sugar phosphate isomerase/epimerase